MNKPEPMTDDDIVKHYTQWGTGRIEGFIGAAKEIEAEVNRRWEEILSKAEPVAWMYPSDLEKFQTSETFAHAYSIKVGCPSEVSEPLYTHPAPQQTKPFDLMVITTAYEQGVGKGIKRDNFNPYEAGTDAHSAWALGYEEGESKPAPQQEKRNLDIIFGDPL